MANEIKLEVYVIRIRKFGEKQIFRDMDTFFDGKDFLTFFQKYIENFDHKLTVNSNHQRTIKLDSKTLNLSISNGMISGIIESGDYGYQSTIFDKDTSEKKYDRQIDDTEIKPFYFLIFLPKKSDKCFLLLQRTGVHGINGIISNHLSDFFKTKYSDYMLELEAFISNKLAKKFIDDGSIKEFTLTRYNLPADIVSKLGLQGHENDILSVQFKIVAKKKSALDLRDRAKRFINNSNAKMFSINALENLGFDGNHDSKMKIKLGRNTRTVDLSDTGQIRPYYDIDKDVMKDKKTGLPIFKSIDEVAKSLLSDLLNELEL